MTGVRIGLIAIAGYLAVVAQDSFVSHLSIGAAPLLLVLAVVVAIGYACGSQAGSVAGFVIGLGYDVTPPADHVAGRWALACCVAGYLAGMFISDNRDESDLLVRLGLRGASSFLAVAVGMAIFAVTGTVTGGAALGNLAANVAAYVGGFAYTAVVAVLIGVPTSFVFIRLDRLRPAARTHRAAL